MKTGWVQLTDTRGTSTQLKRTVRKRRPAGIPKSIVSLRSADSTDSKTIETGMIVVSGRRCASGKPGFHLSPASCCWETLSHSNLSHTSSYSSRAIKHNFPNGRLIVNTRTHIAINLNIYFPRGLLLRFHLCLIKGRSPLTAYQAADTLLQ